MSFSIKLLAPQSAQSFVLSTRSSDYKTRNTSLTLPLSDTQKPNGAFGTKFPISMAVSETHSQSQIQSLIGVLRDSEESGSDKQAKAVHGFVLKSNFSDHHLLVLLNHVTHAYSKCSNFKAARKLFDKMSQRNIFSWTVVIIGSAENGFFINGFELFCEMQTHEILPDEFAYSAILQICIGLESTELGKMVHAQIVIRGFTSHTFVSTALLNMYGKLGKIEESSKVFKTMTEHNVVSWNAIISGFTSNGLHLKAFDHFLKMQDEGIMPNTFTFITVAKAVAKLGDASKGKEVHSCASELGMASNVLVGTGLIDMHSKCGSLDDARSIFYSHFTTCCVNTPWNAMIAGYSRSGCNREALELYVSMCLNETQSDRYTYCSVFNAIADLKHLQFLKEVHAMVIKSGSEMKCISVFNAVADAYAKCGSLEDVRKAFGKMEEKDMVSWTTLVTAYSQCSEWDKAIIIFAEMIKEGFAPNEFTFSSVLVACASLCLLDYGQQVHGLLCKAGLDTEKCIESALIDMYAKCGNITEAEKVFENISNPDTVSWTAIISGYAQHGLVDNALQFFRRMEQLGVKPNGVTLLCVLFACSHGGMVEEGLKYFELMEERYGLVPEMEHYSCIVDLLGRLGRLDDVMKFIEGMPIEPNEMVWQTLLAACRVYGNIELGKLAAQKILSIEPEYSSTYVLLSNTFIETGNHEDGLGMRVVMKKRGVKKEPGYSWISVKGKVHKFYAGDQHHPEKDEIYAKLEELRARVESVGYVPDFSYVL